MVNRLSNPSNPVSTRKRNLLSTTPEFSRKISRFEFGEDREMTTPSEITSLEEAVTAKGAEMCDGDGENTGNENKG